MSILITLCVATILALDANNTTLQQSSRPVILLAQGTGVLYIDLEKHTHISLNNVSAVGVDYHFKKNLLFFSNLDDITDSKIYVQPLNSSEIRHVITADGLWAPTAVAVDWIGNKLYVADEVGRKVDVFELDGSRQAVLLSANLSSPSDVALDPIAGLIFVGDVDQVVRANMDGTHSKTIIAESSDSNHAFSVAVDPETKRLYFVSAILNYIESSDYNGNLRFSILKGQSILINPQRVAVFDDIVFWSDDFAHRISSTNKQNSSIVEEILGKGDLESLTNPKALTVLHASRQPAVNNPCGDNNGECSQFCLVTNAAGHLTYKCACQQGYTLNRDLKNCDLIEEFLIYSRKSVIQAKALHPSINDYNDVFSLDVTMETIIDIDFDSREGNIYYSEINDNRIYRIHRNGTGKETVLDASKTSRGDLQAEGLAVDWMSKNLYYVQSQRGTLHVMSMLNMAYKKTLLKQLRRPRSIVVHPKRGYIFFSEVGKPAAISRGNTDGGRVLQFENITLGWPNGLAIDQDADRVYWCDGLLHHVQHADFEGNDVRTITSSLIGHPFSIAVHAEFIYVTDWKTSGLIRFDKLTGGRGRVLVDEFPRKQMFGVKVYSKKAQNFVEGHPCADRGKCQKFCFAISRVDSEVLWGKCGCSDGEAVAPDGSSCVIASSLSICPTIAFTCDNERCVPRSWRCDGSDDCGDNSDEEHCSR